ncbi:MAG: beta-lactamase family protein [Verrucomicrobia bacterium]|nr:beta-lactamase family protein [Verrucomicrobiota bacterium]
MRDLTRTEILIEEGIEQGLHPGAQLYVSLREKTLADVGFGEARDGVELTPETIMPWLSSCKPVAALEIAAKYEQGYMDFDDPIVEYVPEFGVLGKDTVTLKHVLTHTGGFRGGDRGIKMLGWDDALAHICAVPLEEGWVPGERAGYHVDAGQYILGEAIRRSNGVPFDEYIREAIFLPLGMEHSWIGLPGDRYDLYGDRIAFMYNTFRKRKEVTFLNTRQGCALVRPGGNGRGPVRELGRLYEELLRCLNGSGHLWSAETIQLFTSRQRRDMEDETFGHVMDWGLGFVPDNKHHGIDTVPYSYGPHCSELTFGHSGSQSSTAFADPVHGLVVAVAFNGMPGELLHQKRIRAVCRAIYEDLGLAQES